MKKSTLSFLTVCSLALRLHGHGILHDPFAYSIGTPLIGQSPQPGYTWIGAGPAPGVQPTIQPGHLQVPCMEYATNDLIRLRAGSGPSAALPFSTPGDPLDNYGAVSNGLVFFSFALQVTDTNGLRAEGDYFAGLSPIQMTGAMTPAQIFARVLLRPQNPGYQVGLVKSSGAIASFQWDPRVFLMSDIVQIVGAYRFQENADAAFLWINPDATNFCASTAPPPSLTSLAGPDAVALASFVYLQRPSPAQPAELLTDELHVGSTWQHVVAPGCDFDDLPDGPYRTVKARSGPSHQIVPGFHLGTALSAECDGQPDPLANFDTYDDGVTGLTGFHRGTTPSITVTASGPGELDAYFDWNADGDFLDANEYLYGTSIGLLAGANSIAVPVPIWATLGSTYSRFRLSTTGMVAPGGYAPSGEVEGYRVQILPPVVVPHVDLNLSVVGNATIQMNEDEPYSLNVRVANQSSNTASGVQFTAIVPPLLTAQSITSSTGTCQIQGSNVTCQITSLAPGQNAFVSIVLNAAVADLPGEDFLSLDDLSTMVTSTETDLTPDNNRLGFPVVVVFARDWGDAPTGFPVTNMETGARHRRQAGFFLGAAWDREANGTHSPAADFDDLNGVTPDDEDGVTFLAPLAPGAPVTVTVVASAAGFLDAWTDFNGDNDWVDAGEKIFNAQPLVAGPNILTFSVPAGAKPGTVYSRWRLSETGGLLSTGSGGKGEVEDHLVTIGARLDFGDAPEVIPGVPPVVTTFEVTLGRNGARHDKSGLYLGNNWDVEINGQPNAAADLDDTTGVPDDEDGWTPMTFVPATAMNIAVNVTGGNGLLDVWVDWNQNYTWDAPEHSIIGWPVVPGANIVPINVPGGIPTGHAYARFRLSTTGSPLPSGYAPNGEVEDYYVSVNGSSTNHNPNPVNLFSGVSHATIGDSMLVLGSNGVQISNLGTSGQDGLRINLAGQPGNVRVSLTPLTLNNVGARLQFNLVAEMQAEREATAGEVVLEKFATGLSVRADWSALGSAALQVEVLRDGAVVGTATLSSSNVTGTVTALNSARVPGVQQLAVLTDRPDGAVAYVAQFSELAHFSFPGLEAEGNELRLIALDPTQRIDSLARLEIRAANVAGFTVGGVTTEAPALNLQMRGGAGQRSIQWSQADALLEQAETVSGPWTTASNAMTGVTVDTTSSQKYFRLLQMAARSELAGLVRRAELVFEGTVTQVAYRDSVAQGSNDVAVPHTFVTFSIQRVFKGSYSNGTITLRFAGGLGADGRLLRIKASTLFDVGERSILLVRGNEHYASPLVNWAGGRLRLVEGSVFTESGHELVSTQAGRLEIGAQRELAEVKENDIGGHLLERIQSPDETEEGQRTTPPASEKMSEEAFRQFLADLVKRLHTTHELQNLPPVSSASSVQPFSVPNPAPRRVR